MNTVISWLVAGILFISLMINSIKSYDIGFEKRMAKQQLNLMGGVIVRSAEWEYVETEEEIQKPVCVIDELKCTEEIGSLIGENFAGCIIVYYDTVCSVKYEDSSIAVREYSYGDERSAVDLVNEEINRICSIEFGYAKIEISTQDDAGTLKDYLFNRIGEGTTIFLAYKGGSFITVSGYAI